VFPTSSIGSVAPSAVFISSTTGAENFNLKSGTNALVDAGTSTNGLATDAAGVSRPQGTAYDIGALEKTTAAPASTCTFNSRTIDGQNVTYNFTTANTPTSGSMTLTATGGGGVTQGPSNLTFGTGTASVTFTAVPPGSYDESGTVSGAGGGGAITGLGTLSIASIGGQPEDTPSATVTSVTVSPSTAIGSTTFSATVNGTNSPSQSVTWSATSGTINSSGVFTAPAATGVEQVITITATSVADNTKSGTATVTIAAVAAPPTVTSVTVSPSTATGSATFAATVNGTNSPSQAVTWSTNGGSITSGGVFTAPVQTSSTQTITVTATSVFDNTKSGTAMVTIAGIPAVSAQGGLFRTRSRSSRRVLLKP
jgi:hypothetical protein